MKCIIVLLFSVRTNCVTEEQVERRYQSCCIQVSDGWLTHNAIVYTTHHLLGQPHTIPCRTVHLGNQISVHSSVSSRVLKAKTGPLLNMVSVYILHAAAVWCCNSVVWTVSDVSIVRFAPMVGTIWRAGWDKGLQGSIILTKSMEIAEGGI